MDKATKREVVATLIRANRRDLADQVAGTDQFGYGGFRPQDREAIERAIWKGVWKGLENVALQNVLRPQLLRMVKKWVNELETIVKL